MKAEEATKQRNLIVERLLPEWARLCVKTPKEGEVIVLTESAFSDSPRDMELMGLAIRYAIDRGYAVHVVPFTEASNK